jgi:large subunit ribosomal protein L21
MFVIIKTGGKQYKIQPGDIVKLELLGDEKGKKVTFNDVLACNHEGKDLIGSPFLKNVEVKGEILENKKGKKVIVFKKRRRHNSRRLNGHRQSISVVKINEIILDGKPIVSKKVSKIEEKKVVEKKKVSQEKISPKKGVKNGS